MKKLSIITTVLVGLLILSVVTDSQAQQRMRQNHRQSCERMDRQEGRNVDQKVKNRHAKRHNKVKKTHMKSMRRMAAADGKIHPSERKMMKRHRRHMNRI